jgi:hypothetical protein
MGRRRAQRTAALLSQLDHAWERSWLSDEEIEWQSEPVFAKMKWLSE